MDKMKLKDEWSAPVKRAVLYADEIASALAALGHEIVLCETGEFPWYAIYHAGKSLGTITAGQKTSFDAAAFVHIRWNQGTGQRSVTWTDERREDNERGDRWGDPKVLNKHVEKISTAIKNIVEVRASETAAEALTAEFGTSRVKCRGCGYPDLVECTVTLQCTPETAAEFMQAADALLLKFP